MFYKEATSTFTCTRWFATVTLRSSKPCSSLTLHVWTLYDAIKVWHTYMYISILSYLIMIPHMSGMP
jgi:hypothetical protein